MPDLLTDAMWSSKDAEDRERMLDRQRVELVPTSVELLLGS